MLRGTLTEILSLSIPNLDTYSPCESDSIFGMLVYYSFVIYIKCKYPNGWPCTARHKRRYVHLRAPLWICIHVLWHMDE